MKHSINYQQHDFELILEGLLGGDLEREIVFTSLRTVSLFIRLLLCNSRLFNSIKSLPTILNILFNESGSSLTLISKK